MDNKRMQLIIFIYTFLIISSIINKYYLLLIFLLISIPITILVYKNLKQNKLFSYSLKINEAKKAYKKGKNYTPFLNVNVESWQVIKLIPGISRVAAKRVADYAKNKKIESFVEFANVSDLEPVLYDLVKKIIVF